MTESEQRADVIAEAATWLNTPHHNGARIKGAGVDCGQFPLAVYSACGFVPEFDTGKYPPDFHLHKDREWYLGLAEKYGKELPEGALPKPADFVLYKIGRIFSHGAIVIEWPRIIHAYVGVGVIYDDGQQGHLGSGKHVKDRKFFTLW